MSIIKYMVKIEENRIRRQLLKRNIYTIIHEAKR